MIFRKHETNRASRRITKNAGFAERDGSATGISTLIAIATSTSTSTSIWFDGMEERRR